MEPWLVADIQFRFLVLGDKNIPLTRICCSEMGDLRLFVYYLKPKGGIQAVF